MIDSIDINESEVILKNRVHDHLDFPAVYVTENGFYPNKCARSLFDKSRVRISKTPSYVIFRPTDFCDGYSARPFFNDGEKCRSGAYIGSKRVVQELSVKQGRWFKLYAAKDGAYAIKRNEPLEDEM